jgi:hypothetical protein
MKDMLLYAISHAVCCMLYAANTPVPMQYAIQRAITCSSGTYSDPMASHMFDCTHAQHVVSVQRVLCMMYATLIFLAYARAGRARPACESLHTDMLMQGIRGQ